jgi:hypothetical protein
MPINISPEEEEAIKIISPRKYHRLFNLPATENHGPLKVSYAIAGPEDGDVPTILLCGGMFCTRWHTIGYEHIAQENGVRVLSIDRLVFSIIHPRKFPGHEFTRFHVTIPFHSLPVHSNPFHFYLQWTN